MAEYTNPAVQTVAPGAPVLFNERIGGCGCGILHRAGSGLFILLGPGAYRVTFNGNLAVPTDGTVGPVSVAVAVEGESLYSSTATVTPTVADAYFNVTSAATVYVPCRCCLSVSVRNAGTGAVDVANPNLIIEPI